MAAQDLSWNHRRADWNGVPRVREHHSDGDGQSDWEQSGHRFQHRGATADTGAPTGPGSRSLARCNVLGFQDCYGNLSRCPVVAWPVNSNVNWQGLERWLGCLYRSTTASGENALLLTIDSLEILA
jgi:hypothetical protein